MNELPKVNQYIKTKKGDKVWKVWAVDNDSIALMGVTNGKGHRISHEQYFKTWEVKA